MSAEQGKNDITHDPVANALGACERPHDFLPDNGTWLTATVFRCRKCGGCIERRAFLWWHVGVGDGMKSKTEARP